MEKICLIKQPAGFGDIIFCQKIAKILQEKTEYKKIIWPVAPVYSYLNEYMGDDDLYFPNETDDFPCKEVYQSGSIAVLKSEEFFFIPLQSSDSMFSACTCHNNPRAHGHIKYNFCDMEYHDWKDYVAFRRFEDRECALIEHLGLNILELLLIVSIEIILNQIMIIRMCIWNLLKVFLYLIG